MINNNRYNTNQIICKKEDTERGPDIVRMPSMGQKRTISGMRTISEGHKIPMVVMLFITP